MKRATRRLLLTLSTLSLAATSTAAQCPFEACAERIGPGSADVLASPGLVLSGPPVFGSLNGTPFEVGVVNCAPDAVGLLVTSGVEVAVPLAAYDAVLYVAPPFLDVSTFQANGDGTASPVLSVSPIDPSLCGFEVATQAAAFDPTAVGGLELSDGFRVRAGIPAFGGSYAQFGTIPLDGVRSVFADDLDGDGLVDLAAVSLTANRLSVYRGDVGGDFTPIGDHVTGTSPAHVTGGDLNADGVVDLVTTSLGANGQVSAFLGLGDGTFANPVLVGTASCPLVAEIADWNGDGAPDVASADLVADVALLALGNGDGTFGPATTFPAGARPAHVTAADLDLDGKLDLLVAGGPGATLLWGRGDGTFDPPQTVAAGTDAIWIESAQLDLDGIPDLILTNNDAGTVTVFLGRGSRAFDPPTAYPVGSVPHAVAVTDGNRDGFPDLVVSNLSSDSLSILQGLGTGGFFPLPPVGTGSGPLDLVLADVDRDGLEDVLVACVTGGLVQVLTNDAFACD